MENILFLIAVLACPLGMVAMGGIAWVWAKAVKGRSGDNRQSADPAGDVT